MSRHFAQICVGVKNPIMALGITLSGIEAAMVLEYVRAQSGLGLLLLHSLSPDLICISRFYYHLILVETKSEPCIYEELNVCELYHKILCTGFNQNYFVVQAWLYDLCLSLLGLQMN
jgi:hypothetical protein